MGQEHVTEECTKDYHAMGESKTANEHSASNEWARLPCNWRCERYRESSGSESDVAETKVKILGHTNDLEPELEVVSGSIPEVSRSTSWIHECTASGCREQFLEMKVRSDRICAAAACLVKS